MPSVNAAPIKPPRAHARWIWVGILVVLLAALTTRHLVLHAKITAALARLRSAKEPITSDELNLYYTAVPENENAARFYEPAFASLRRTDTFGFLETPGGLPAGTNALPEDLRQQMEKVVADNQGPLDALKKAADLKACRFSVDYSNGFLALLPHLPKLKDCGWLEVCNGVLKEQAGDTDAAIQSAVRISKYATSLDSEPDLISVLFQHQLDSQALELSRWIINRHKLTEAQISVLQNAFKSTEKSDWIDRAIFGDRAATLQAFDYPATDFVNLISSGQNDFYDRLTIRLSRFAGQMKKDEITYLARLDQIRELSRLPLPTQLDRAQALSSEIRAEARSQWLFATGSLLPGLIKGFDKNAQHLARMRLIQTALAIELFRTKHGEPPESLPELGSDYLPQLPLDPFDGEHLRYRRNVQGYVLYSVGPDRWDDEGQKSLPWNSKETNLKGDITFSVGR